MVVLYQLNCQRMVAQWLGEGADNTKGQYSDYTEDVRWGPDSDNFAIFTNFLGVSLTV